MKKKPDDSIALHPKHGLAPMLTYCVLCHKDVGIALLGAKANEICNGVFGEPYRRCQGTTYKMPEKIPCDECQERLKSGAVAFIANDGSALTLSPEFGIRNNIKPGIYRMKQDQFDAFKAQAEAANGPTIT